MSMELTAEEERELAKQRLKQENTGTVKKDLLKWVNDMVEPYGIKSVDFTARF